MLRFTKGHGTENDFVLVADREGTLRLGPEHVARLCDRHAGIGGDGLIRVVPTAHAEEPSVRELAGEAEWFMDYRNHDGSVAEMCGNGTRVFAEFLRREGLVASDDFAIATRAGVKQVRTTAEGYAVNLGPWRFDDPKGADRDGFDVMARVHHGKPVPALSVDLGNPHTVLMLPEGIELARIDLTVAPEVHPEPRNGTNVEVVRAAGPRHIEMRVHERGVGETRSCGTGAAAAALATMFWAGEVSATGELLGAAPTAAGSDATAQPSESWIVDVPGGRLTVTAMPDRTVELAGPAVLVADGETSLA